MTDARSVLLLGGFGQLGSEIRRRWTDFRIFSPSHAELEIKNTEAVANALVSLKPGVLVNCAAFHNVERCESEPAEAFAANAVAVNGMAERCAEFGVTFVTFSTDYVFDGTLGRAYEEGDAPHPLSVYAASKYAGELLVDRLCSNAYVVRTCGVYGTHFSPTKGYTFLDRVITQARAGEKLRIVQDQTVSPTYAGDLANAVLQLLETGAPPGVYHAVDEGPVSWFDFAQEALRQADIAASIEPISYRDWNSRVRRPEFSALTNAKLRSLGIEMPDWRMGITNYLRDKAALA